nr:DUF5672 family protein [uncultured Flavobacterium sp.]
MKSNTLCVVVIPVHNDKPSYFELISFKQCFDVFKKHSIKIIAPVGLNLDGYKQVVSTFEIIAIDPIWQSSIEKYNKLKLSWFFYDQFKEFDFLLTYELDAFVFKDEIDFWCQKNYDYIGAPWFVGYSVPTSDEIIGVGNSGFSLRKISAMKNAIHKIYFDERNYNLSSKKKRIKAKIKRFLFFVNIFRKENYTIQNSLHVNEDWFISDVIPKFIVDFNIAPINDAIKFSFEVNPSYLFEINNQNLPTGCHAWNVYDFEFWKPHIVNCGYNF